MGTATNVQAWSTTPASNDGADSTIGTVANTSIPTVVDDWVKGIMAAIAKYADDTGGALVAGGTATALTVTTGQGLSSGHIANGLRIAVRTASAATGAATIALDGLTAVDIKANNGSAIASGDWPSGAVLDLVYSSAATAFLAANIHRQIATIELGHASDTTLSRISAGVMGVEGVALARVSSSTDADSLLDTLGSETKGALIYHNGTSWVVLAPPGMQGTLSISAAGDISWDTTP